MSEIAEKVKAIIIDKLGVEASEVTPEASFTNDLGADSLDTVELIMEFEKEFNVEVRYSAVIEGSEETIAKTMSGNVASAARHSCTVAKSVNTIPNSRNDL